MSEFCQALSLLIDAFQEAKYAYERAYLDAAGEEYRDLPETKAYAHVVGRLIRIPKAWRWLFPGLKKEMKRLEVEHRKAIVREWRRNNAP